MLGVRLPPGLSFFYLSVLRMLTKAKEFLTDVKVEVKKVTWPSRKEAIGGTMVVLVVVFFVSLYLGIIDTLLSKIVESLISG